MEDIKEELPKPILVEDLGMLYPTTLSNHKTRFGIYKCGFCGSDFKAYTHSIKSGHTKSCGCYRIKISKEINVTHNLTNTKLYSIWGNMKTRVVNPTDKDYHNYGGRGITMCEGWKNDFMSFYDWAMTNGYSEGLSIDRIDNNGNYEPSNCRWTTKIIQSRNQRMKKNNTSGYKGVSYVKKARKYQVYVSTGKKHKYIGLYPTAEDGAVAYNNYIISNDLEGFPLNKLPDSHIHLQLPTKPHHQTLG